MLHYSLWLEIRGESYLPQVSGQTGMFELDLEFDELGVGILIYSARQELRSCQAGQLTHSHFY